MISSFHQNFRATRPSCRLARFSVFLLTFVGALSTSSAADTPDYLAGDTVLIIRHAEKPPEGRALTPMGEARARAYVRYFEPFRENGLDLRVDALYAGADSNGSIRPRLTLEPLAQAIGLPLNTAIGTKAPADLVSLLRTQPHGTHPLIAWRHGQIPALLAAFGASPTLIPGGTWPDDTFDWVIILNFDSAGHLAKQLLVKEHLAVPQQPRETSPAASESSHAAQ